METITLDTDSIERLTNNLNNIYNYTVNKESYQKLAKTLDYYVESLNEVLSIEYKSSLENFAENFAVIMDRFAKSISKYDYSTYFKEFRQSFEKLGNSLSDLHVERIKEFSQMDVSRFKVDLNYQNDKYSEASNIAYDITNEQTKGIEENISETDLQEAYSKEQDIGFQEWLYNQSENFKKKYYVYKLIFDFIKFLLGAIVAFYISDALAKGSVKEEPVQHTTIIYNITQETNVTIIGEVNYYYKIIFEDEYGNEITGYIAKRNVKVLPIGEYTIDDKE